MDSKNGFPIAFLDTVNGLILSVLITIHTISQNDFL